MHSIPYSHTSSPSTNDGRVLRGGSPFRPEHREGDCRNEHRVRHARPQASAQRRLTRERAEAEPHPAKLDNLRSVDGVDPRSGAPAIASCVQRALLDQEAIARRILWLAVLFGLLATCGVSWPDNPSVQGNCLCVSCTDMEKNHRNMWNLTRTNPETWNPTQRSQG